MKKLVLALLFVLAAPLAARAQEPAPEPTAEPVPEPSPEPSPDPSPVPTSKPGTPANRRDLAERNPLFTVRASAFSGLPDMFGLSASLTALHPFEIEGGASVYSLGILNGGGYYGRAGAVYALPTRGRTTLEVKALGGYRRQKDLPYPFLGPECPGRCEREGATLGAGVESVTWLAPHFGISLQAFGGAIYWFNRTGDERGPVWPDIRLSAGLAF